MLKDQQSLKSELLESEFIALCSIRQGDSYETLQLVFYGEKQLSLNCATFARGHCTCSLDDNV